MKRLPFFALLITAAALPVAAQAVQLSLDGLASKAKDPQIQKLIAGLKNITVKKYNFAEEGQYKPEDLQPVRDQLRAAGWGVMIGKHEKGENTDVWAKSEGGLMTGIAVVKADPKQVTVVYIEGAIDLVGLAGLA